MENRIELAWLTGIIEGEGCFCLLLEDNIGHSYRRIAYNEIDNSYLKAMQALKSISESVETNTLSIQFKLDKDRVRTSGKPLEPTEMFGRLSEPNLGYAN